MNEIKLSIVLPTYNEYQNIKVFIPKIEEVFADTSHEIIVVDDDSNDGTPECVLELNKRYGNIKLMARRNKKGLGSALKDGYDAATGEIILSSDTDLSFSVKDMKRLVAAIDQGCDLVVGCRHGVEGSHYQIRNLRTVIKGCISKLGNFTLRTLTNAGVHDFSANFRAIRNDAWQKLHTKETTNIMLFEMIIKAKYKKMRIKEIPVSFVDRIYGESKLKLSIEIPKFMVKMMYYIFKYR